MIQPLPSSCQGPAKTSLVRPLALRRGLIFRGCLLKRLARQQLSASSPDSFAWRASCSLDPAFAFEYDLQRFSCIEGHVPRFGLFF